MAWYVYVASLFAGMFLANAVPHFVKGICGDAFPTPFAKPPGKGLSSPLVNVVWAIFNGCVGAELFRVGRVSSGSAAVVVVFVAGITAISVMLSVHFVAKDAA
ncbi:MAG: hypothetical protein HIU91_14265 [Acidobacteria bacterium]|nr:hypothetical protein [Acidobacteriota bacterium]